MQWLSLVTEDAGVQRLKADNRLPVITRSVDAVSPYPAVHPAHIGEGKRIEPVTGRDRRGKERRRGERRKQQVPVILDTRCANRRDIENRRSSSTTEATEAPFAVRINLYA